MNWILITINQIINRMPDTFKDDIPVEPTAEMSLDNVLTDIRFRGWLGFKLKDYTLSANFSSVELEFEKCGLATTKKVKKT